MFFKSILKTVATKASYFDHASKFAGHDSFFDAKKNLFCKDDDDDKHGKHDWLGQKDKFGRDDDKHDWWKSHKDRDDDDKHGKGKDDDCDDDDKHGKHDWWKGHKDRDDDHKHGWGKGHHGRDDDDKDHCGDDKEPDEPTYEKVFFGYDFDDSGNPAGGYFITAEAPNPNPYNIQSLPEGTEPTFANYVAHFESIGGDVTQTEAVVFYENDAQGVPQESFRVEAPEGGFEDADDVIQAYENALEENDAQNLMVSLSIEPDQDDAMDDMAEDEEEDDAEEWAA